LSNTTQLYFRIYLVSNILIDKGRSTKVYIFSEMVQM